MEGFGPVVYRFLGVMVGAPVVEESGSVFGKAEPGFDERPFPLRFTE